jgi:hypothetical protein
MRALVALIAFCFFVAVGMKMAVPAKQPASAVVEQGAAAESDSPFRKREADTPAQIRALPPQAAILPIPRPDPSPSVNLPKAETAVLQTPKLPSPQTPSKAPCTDLLTENIAEFQLSSSVSGETGNAFCGDEAPVRMTAVKLRDGNLVQLAPAVLSRCEMALEFARWVRDDLSEAARLAGTALRRINIASSYSCRPINNVMGQRMSEHGLANAVDIGSVALANGKTFPIFSPEAPAILLATMRASACTRFTTVLGPGADAAHANHIHVDLAQRRGGYRICQWNMPDWPLP